ncbi:MAG: DUF4105 domain-containing protein [Roseobacter sp.]
MRAVLKFALAAIAFLVIAYSMLWGSLAIWFKMPVSELAKYLVIAIFLIPGVLSLVHLFTKKTRRAFLVYAVFFAALLAWWNTLTPPADGDWAPTTARQVTGTIEGDILTLDGVREFQWRSENDFTENWTKRTYDLSQLETLDLFLSYWGDPKMAHFMLSFGFGNDEFLTWSIEVRRYKDGNYSPVADFFKAHPLVIFAAEEYDVVGLRSNVWDNDVHIFRLPGRPENMRPLLEEYVSDANRLAERPHWYNSLFTNCTTVVFKMMDAVGVRFPFDWRIIVNGYMPEWLHDEGFLNANYTTEELRALGRINERAKANGLNDGFSAAIREGVPRWSDQ